MNGFFAARLWRNETALFWSAVLFSLLMHGLLFCSGRLSMDMIPSRRTVEIDLTPSAPKKTSRPAASPPQVKAWVVPKTEAGSLQPLVPKMASEESSAGVEGSNDDGFMEAIHVSRYPQLLNLVELQSNLIRFYPEYERLKRNEGNVTLELRINEEGRVVGVEVIRSASPAFSEAAKRVALLLKFKPAMVGRNKVAVKLRQTISFKLEG